MLGYSGLLSPSWSRQPPGGSPTRPTSAEPGVRPVVTGSCWSRTGSGTVCRR